MSTPVVDIMDSIAYHYPVEQAKARLILIYPVFNDLVGAGSILASKCLASPWADSPRGVEPYLCVQSLISCEKRLPAAPNDVTGQPTSAGSVSI